MSRAVIQTSFAAGELSPALFARVDLEKYHSGAASLRNFFVDYRGGASTRAGTEFIGACLSGGSYTGQPRTIPFVVNTTAAYALEFGNEYIRFVANGAYVIDPGTGQPLIIVSPYAVADLPLLKYTQSADVMTLVHPSYPVYNLKRLTATTFSLSEDIIGPLISPPANVNVTQANVVNLKNFYGYIVTTVGPNSEESLGAFPAYVAGDILNQVASPPIVNDIGWDPVTTGTSYRVYKAGPTPTDDGQTSSPPSTVFGFIGEALTNSFVDNNIAPDYSQTPPTFADPFSPGQIASVSVDVSGSGGGYAGAILAPLVFTGGGGTDAAGYGVWDRSSAMMVGVVLTNPGKNYTTLPVVTDVLGDTTYTVTLGQLSGTYPAAVGYFQQRRFYGGTNNLPESFTASQPGLYDNFNTNPISLASDAITASIASREVNAIKSFTSMPTGLVVLTTGGGFLVSGGNGQAVTPSSIIALPQASSGCNDLPPLVINYDILYAQNRGAVVRDLAFNFYVQSYTGTDRSVLASHLFSGFSLSEWCYSEEPFRLVQVVRNDGTLLNFTYVPEQEIFAWTPADTNGYFRSICSVPEGQVNAVYVIVQRFVNSAWVYYMERFDSRLWETPEDSWCVDCGLALPQTRPQANLVLSAISGGNITVTADAAVFNVGQIGDTLWAFGAQAVITAFIDTTHVTAAVTSTRPFPAVPNSLTPAPIPNGDWSLDTPVMSISGLDHLDGCTVTGLADGKVILPTVVVAGAIALPNPATKVVVGLGYQCQLQTLKIDLGEPTVQGKRKQIAALTARVLNSLGLKTGVDFTKLYDMKDLISQDYPPNLITIDARTLLPAQWNKEGQVCFQQDYPLPATILGVIPEVTVGDTQR